VLCGTLGVGKSKSRKAAQIEQPNQVDNRLWDERLSVSRTSEGLAALVHQLLRVIQAGVVNQKAAQRVPGIPRALILGNRPNTIDYLPTLRAGRKASPRWIA
jgi:hypothetical protein